VSVLTAEGISKSFGAQVVLDDVSVVLQPTERVGLLGRNGMGKSTLARILAGVASPDAGSVQVRKDASVFYLSQEPHFESGRSVRDIVVDGLGEWQRARRRYDEVSARLAEGQGDESTLLDEQARIEGEIVRLGGWDLEHQATSMLQRVGAADPDALVDTLSGGELRRVALAQLLVARPDVAILDEPTNHLDVATIEWLERHFAEEYPGALLLITHDRYLLEALADRILELDRGKLHGYRGGWSDYLEAKALREEHEARTQANRQRYLKTELEWLRRSPKARTTKQKARIKRIEEAASQPKQVRVGETRLEVESARAGKTICELQGLQVDVAGKLLVDGLDVHMVRGERLGIIGPNGAGKTSLLRVLMGQLEPRAGKVVLGKSVRVGYLEQARKHLDEEASIYDNVIGNLASVQLGDQTLTPDAYLRRFLFDRYRVRDKVAVLSGGERARVALARMLVEPLNLLLLDEPTNDLDVQTLSALEEMLIGSDATALVVTHDRYFLDRVATAVLSFEGGGLVRRYADASQALRALRKEERAGSVKKPAPARRAVPSTGDKLTYGEAIELEGLMDRIAEAERAAEKLEQALADPSLYAERGAEVPALQRELQEAQVKVEALLARWEELEERKQRS
jgi:ATP-binding cassette subfamily F protein uup